VVPSAQLVLAVAVAPLVLRYRLLAQKLVAKTAMAVPLDLVAQAASWCHFV
jgi:hypothetical protein